jgi:hypothetical protein
MLRGPPTPQEGKALRCFYRHAVAGDVAAEHVTAAAARAFALDKWAARCDKMCCALLCLAARRSTSNPYLSL